MAGAIDNRHDGKHLLLYDGHDRAAGVSKGKATRKWRRMRRLTRSAIRFSVQQHPEEIVRGLS